MNLNNNPKLPRVELPRFSPAARMAYDQKIIEMVRLGGMKANPMRDWYTGGAKSYEPELNPNSLKIFYGQLAGMVVGALLETFDLLLPTGTYLDRILQGSLLGELLNSLDPDETYEGDGSGSWDISDQPTGTILTGLIRTIPNGLWEIV